TQELKRDIQYRQEFRIKHPEPFQKIGISHLNLKASSAKLRETLQQPQTREFGEIKTSAAQTLSLDEVPFSHLHNHSQFSVLQSTISVADLVKAAAAHNMPAVALTDHGNMMGAFHFVSQVAKHNKEVKAKNEAA